MITISPVGLVSTANQLPLLVGLKEKLCKSYCKGSFNPIVSVTYSNSAPTLSGSTVFIPITVVVTVVSPNKCCNNTQIFAETFIAAFQDQTAIPTTITITSEGHIEDIVGSCNNNHLAYNDSIMITIA